MYEMTFIVVLIFIFLIIKELVTLSLTSWEAKITHSWKAGNLPFCHLWNLYLVSLNISFFICKIWNKNSNLLIELLLSHYYLIVIINETIKIKLCLARSELNSTKWKCYYFNDNTIWYLSYLNYIPPSTWHIKMLHTVLPSKEPKAEGRREGGRRNRYSDNLAHLRAGDVLLPQMP